MNIIETNLTFGEMTTRSKTNRIILHHSASTSATAEQIHNWHLQNGWAGAGYHFLVRKDGQIYRLRPEDKVGAHASGSNSDSLGICAEGNFESESMTDTQKNSIKELVSYLKNKYNISKVQKHSDVCSTACPGKNYPFDEIANTTSSSTTSSTTTNTTTSTGNSTIKTIQSTLNTRYSTGLTTDGIYGSQTKMALVKGLQTELNKQYKANLTIDGIFGTKTKNACPTVKKGASGNITYLIQSMLYMKGYSISVDGIYGSNTQNIIKSFQTKSGISSDGICGKNTFEKLFK